MTRFYYDGKNQKIMEAVRTMEHTLMSSQFRTRLNGKPVFYMASNKNDLQVVGSTVLDLLDKNMIRCQVQTYKPCNPWSKAIAMYKGGKDIYLNSRKLDRSVHSIKGSIMHEYMHLLDNFLKDYYLGHGDNSSKGKAHTVPYWLGSLAKEVSLELYREGFKG